MPTTSRAASLCASIGRSVLRLRAIVPEDAFTVGILGAERIGSGVVIADDGLILTIGYLITEASDVWIGVEGGRELAGHPLAHDQVTGFGLVLPLEPLRAEPVPLGHSAEMQAGSHAFVVSAPALGKPQAVRVQARRVFAGAWEYLLDDAIFTLPAHAHWSGAALIDTEGALVGLGSLLVREAVDGKEANANMFVPIDLLKPILAEMRSGGAPARTARPWLGLYAVDVGGRVFVTGVAQGSPAQRADLREGDLLTHLAGEPVTALPTLYRAIWSLGPAGTPVPLSVLRANTRLEVTVRSVDRRELLKRPVRH